MPIDLVIPFAILVGLVVYLIYSRSRYESSVVEIYEKKFEEWKEHSQPEEKQEVSHKELVGLIFKKDGKIELELFDERSESRIQRGKFTTKVK